MPSLPTSRRDLLFGVAMAGAAAPATARPSNGQSPTAALRSFLAAFESCDIERMQSFFAADATFFDRFPPGAQSAAGYVRGRGMPPGMRELCSRLLKAGGSPPYHTVEPKDLLVQSYDDVAVCTFHLTGGQTLGRRTVVLNRRGSGWKIVHVHASNMPLA
jgi:ketosteroid isomerase-like protein